MRVVIVDDHPLILDAIANLVRAAGHEVVAAVGGSKAMLDVLQDHPADVVTLDIGMPGLNGIETARLLRDRLPEMRVIFITQQVDAAYLRAALKAGARAFISKQSASQDILTALQAVSRDRSFVSANLIEQLGDAPGLVANHSHGKEEVLTPRQRQVLQQLAEGKSIKEIACALDISSKTVEFHKQTIATALGIKTTAELTRYAIAHGLTFL